MKSELYPVPVTIPEGTVELDIEIRIPGKRKILAQYRNYAG